MSESGQGRPDSSFASTLKVQRSAVGSDSGRHETAPPMSQLGRSDSLTRGLPNVRFPALDAVICRSRKGGQLATRKKASRMRRRVVTCTNCISSVCVGSLIKR
jgi:hypothetical protein